MSIDTFNIITLVISCLLVGFDLGKDWAYMQVEIKEFERIHGKKQDNDYDNLDY